MSGTKNFPLGGVLDGEKHEPLPGEERSRSR